MSLLYDHDPRATLNRQQRQLADDVADCALLRIGGLADADLPTGPLGRKAMQIRVVARSNLAAATTIAAGPGARIRIVTQTTRGQIHRQSRLADRTQPCKQDGMRRPTEDHRIDLGQGARLAARCGVLHGVCGLSRRLVGGWLATLVRGLSGWGPTGAGGGALLEV